MENQFIRQTTIEIWQFSQLIEEIIFIEFFNPREFGHQFHHRHIRRITMPNFSQITHFFDAAFTSFINAFFGFVE